MVHTPIDISVISLFIISFMKIVYYICSYFDSIDICKYRSDWMESRVQGSFPFNSIGEIRVANIEVFQPTQVEFGLFQEGTR